MNLLLLVFLFFVSAEEKENPFLQGIASYNAKEFEAAKGNFETALEETPRSPEVLYNLGLTYHQLGEFGRAIAFFRKALDAGGYDASTTEAIKFTQDQLQVKSIPHKKFFLESLRDVVFVPIKTSVFLGAFLFMTLVLGWTLLSYLGYRRRSLFAEVTPQRPSFVLFLFATLWIFSLATVSLDFYDHFVPRATVIEKETPVFSAPTDQAVELFRVFQGFEVVTGKIKDEWVQITYPGGLSGWVPKKVLIHSSGRTPW